MTDYSWPSSVVPARSPLTWMDNTSVFVSPLSGTVRTETQSGGRWAMSLTPPLRKNSITLGLYEAFLFRLNGAEHRAVIRDFAYVRNGAGGGTPLVNGASQTGLSLITDGWPNSTLVLRAGDRIGISNQMIPVVVDATSNGSGQATLTLAHPIRTAPSNNASIEIDNPTARYILVDRVTFESEPGIFKTAIASFEEDIV